MGRLGSWCWRSLPAPLVGASHFSPGGGLSFLFCNRQRRCIVKKNTASELLVGKVRKCMRGRVLQTLMASGNAISQADLSLLRSPRKKSPPWRSPCNPLTHVPPAGSGPAGLCPLVVSMLLLLYFFLLGLPAVLCLFQCSPYS